MNSKEKHKISGYRALHHAAAWGRVECLKVLVEGGANLHHKTTYDETARDIALRYKQTECVDFLDWAGMAEMSFKIDFF